MASCLQWPGTQNGHWCAPALFYASLLFALVAIVTGSQQLLVVPNERSADADAFAGASLAMKLEDGQESEMAASEREHLQAIVDRLCQTHRPNQSNSLHIFALQAPMMLLSLSVMAFLGGLCSVIIAPLVQLPVWNDHAKVCSHCSRLSVEFVLTVIDCCRIWSSGRLQPHNIHQLFSVNASLIQLKNRLISKKATHTMAWSGSLPMIDASSTSSASKSQDITSCMLLNCTGLYPMCAGNWWTAASVFWG